MYHQCSGKHIGLIYSSRQSNHSIENYMSATHPINKKFFAKIKELSQEDPIIGIDGCLNATPGLSYKAFLNLCQTTLDNPSKKMQNCFELWQRNPRLVGGINRLDSDISEDLGGEFLAKEGADGLLLILHPKRKLTILTKLYHGGKKEWLTLALWSALKRLDSKDEALVKLKNYLTLKVRDCLKENQELSIVQE